MGAFSKELRLEAQFMSVFTTRVHKWLRLVCVHREQGPVFVGEWKKKIEEMWVDSISFGLELGGMSVCMYLSV